MTEDGPISLVVDQAATKGKIVVESLTEILAQDDAPGNTIDFSVGPSSATIVTPNPDIFSIDDDEGVTTFTGTGASGKAFVEFSTEGDTTEINVNNGTAKSSNIFFGSTSSVTTDDN